MDLLNKRTGHDRSIMQGMFEVFINHYPDYFEEGQKYIEQKNWEGLSSVMHRAKSAVAIMGMEDIRNGLESIEFLAQKGQQTENFHARLSRLFEQTKLAAEEIQEYLEKH